MLSTNIKYLRDKENVTQAAFGKLFDISRDNVASYERGTEPPLDVLKKIVNHFHTTLDQLCNEDFTKKEIYTIKTINKGKTDRSKDGQGVPFYDTPATAGAVSLFSQLPKHVPAGHISMPNMPKCDGAIPITGDSMYPLLKSGDTVLYKIVNDKTTILWGEMYIAMIIHDGDEYFFVKYINKSTREGYARFVSYNDHHQPVEFPIDSIKALALVKASIRINHS